MICLPCSYFQDLKTKEPPKKLIGHLNRKYGYNYYTPIPEGSPVYEDKKGYYVEHTLIATGAIHKAYWYKDSGIVNHINFL